MDATQLLPGDFVQARMKGTTEPSKPDQYLVTEFHVTDVAGTLVHGSVLYPDGLDQAAGWGFELIARTLTLPDALCEITADLIDGRVLTLMGKGTVWADVSSGDRIDPALIQSFATL